MQNFNVIIAGVGGQGIITLVSVLDEACLIQGYDVKSSELHGLSQRGGSVITHVRFGKKVYSPLVSKGKANLIIGLEILESLREAIFAGPDTVFVVNNYSKPFESYMPKEEILSNLNRIAGENLHLVQASNICQEKLEKEVVSTMYLLGYAVAKKIIPLEGESVIKALKSVIPQKYLDLNIKAFNLGIQS